MNIKNLLWIAPFCSFFIGYRILTIFNDDTSILMPLLVGNSAYQAIETLSKYRLTPCVVATKERTDLAAGTILEQTPPEGTPIKQRQSIYLVLSKEPEELQVSSLIGKTKEEIIALVANMPVKLHTKQIPHRYHPKNYCFAYTLYTGNKNSENRLLVYLSTGDQEAVIWPDFKQMNLEHVYEFLNIYTITPHILETKEHDHQPGCVINQRPAAGSVIERSMLSNIHVQLLIAR